MRIGLMGVILALASTTFGCKTATPVQSSSSCANDLSGTWDVLATRPENPSGTRAYVLTISASTFTMSDTRHNLSYTAQGTKQLTWTSPVGVRSIAVSNDAAAVNTGSLPLAVGGSWTFTTTHEACTASVTAGLVTGSCQGMGDSQVGGVDWPYPLPSPANGVTYSATRSSPLASQLGDLGGEWATTGGQGTCSVRLEGNRMTATCAQVYPLSGSLQMTLGSDCVASGTSGGFELSARRR